MRSCPPSPLWAAHEIFARVPSVYGSFARRLRRPVRPQGPADGAHFPRSCRDLHHTARRPAARLAAAGRLPILGRLGAPGAFLRVPQKRPAKHQPDHYRRDEPGGQADQHPRPRAHLAHPQRHIPDTGRAPYPSHDQPCRSVTAERRYRAPLRSRARTAAGTTPADSPAPCWRVDEGGSPGPWGWPGTGRCFAAHWGKETQPGGAPALGTQPAGCTRSQLSPRTTPAARLPRTGQDMRQATTRRQGGTAPGPRLAPDRPTRAVTEGRRTAHHRPRPAPRTPAGPSDCAGASGA